MSKRKASLPSKADRKAITNMLGELTSTLETLLLSGLASASQSTETQLAQTFRDASQLRLLRLGSTLRIAAEEVGRYTRNDPLFSRRRYSFFINRAWMLSRGLQHAIEQQDVAHWQSLTWQAGGATIDSLQVVALGVSKRVVPDAFCGFEFRLRRIDDGSDAPLKWSTIFPLKKGIDVPAEAYLRLPQKQKFKASDFLERQVIQVDHCQLSEDGRIQMNDDTTVELKDAFEDWGRLATWDPASAFERLQQYEVNPFELDIELQEEAIVRDWRIAREFTDDREQRVQTELVSGGVSFQVFSAKGREGKTFRARLKKWAKESLPIFGILHYEHGDLVLQPLSVMEIDGPAWLSLDEKDIDYRNLIKALNL
ncbi:MAG: hypothetical protein AB8B91_12090 [Rubripirellula sp.]